MVAPFLLLSRNGISRGIRDLSIVILSSASWIFSNVFLMFALGNESSGISAILTYTQPLFVFGMSAVFLKNEVTRVKLISVLVGLGGIGMIYFESLGKGVGSNFTILFLLLGAFLWAVSIVSYKLVSDVVHPYWMSFAQVALGSFLVLPFALATGGLGFSVELPYILSLTYVTVLSTLVASFLWFYLLKNEDAVTVSSSSLMVPVLAFVVGASMLREAVDLYQITGVALVLIGVYFVNTQT